MRLRCRQCVCDIANALAITYSSDILNTLSRPSDASYSDFSFFHFFKHFFYFYTLPVTPSSPSLHPPVPPSSPFFLPPRPSFLLVPPCSSFFLVRHCLNHLESIKGHFSSIFTKALRTNQRTNGPTDRRTDKTSYRDVKTHLKSKQ